MVSFECEYWSFVTIVDSIQSEVGEQFTIK